jgi:hypothetical protein
MTFCTIQTVDLGDRVDHHVADAGLDGVGEFVDGFIVAVQGDPLGRESGVQGDCQFAAGGDVERETLLGDPPGDLTAEEGLGGIVHIGATPERGGHVAAAAAEVVLVDDEERGAVLRGQFGYCNARHQDLSVVAAKNVARPHIRRQRQRGVGALRSRREVGVVDLLGMPGTGRVDVHIRSGAVTPRIAKPFPITCRVASHNASRARFRSPDCSSPCGRTRQES